MVSQEIKYLAGDPNGKIYIKHSTSFIGHLEVLVKVTHSGLCGTDVHDRASGCGLGHEGVGIVERIGGNVTAVRVGGRVGWGYVLYPIRVVFDAEFDSDGNARCEYQYY